VVGHGEDQLPDARPGHRAPRPRRAERASAPSTSCWPAVGSAGRGCGYSTITGQGNGQGGREHGQKCDQLPGGRDIANPEHRATSPGLGHRPRTNSRTPGSTATRSSASIETRRDPGLLSICFNPVVSLPDSTFVKRMLEKLEFYVASTSS
jgi:assimilatory nitrate reductase catalytic subunit